MQLLVVCNCFLMHKTFILYKKYYTPAILVLRVITGVYFFFFSVFFIYINKNINNNTLN